jgi:hypothetical protein
MNRAPTDSLTATITAGDFIDRMEQLDVDALRILAGRLQTAQSLILALIRSKVRQQRREREEAGNVR